MEQTILDRSLRDVLRGLGRYYPFLGTILVVVLIVTLLPGKQEAKKEAISGAAASSVSGNANGAAAAGATDVAAGTQAAAGVSGVQTGTAITGGAGGGGSAAVRPAGVPPAAKGVVSTDPLSAPDCDRATGRIKFPSKWAYPCIPDFPKGGDNGGATYIGVSKDTIKVAVRECSSADAQAINAALGNTDTQQQVEDTIKGYISMFNFAYQTYGRKVVPVFYQCAGSDDESAKADAIKVATEIKAFATMGGPAVYTESLASRGILCLGLGCYTSAAIENYLRLKPHVWGWYITNTQAYKHRIEYLGKKLCGRQAKWAGDTVYKTQKRKFAILSFNDPPKDSYKAGAEFGQREMTKYTGADGQQCSAELIFQTLNVQTAQEDARTIIAKLKNDGINSVLLTCDPVSPIFFLKEATNQQYFPEWVIGASVLTDTTFFGRLYDQQQWKNAFGISWNPARVPADQGDAYKLYVWHNGAPPPAQTSYSVFYPDYLMLFTGVALAGPKLTNLTFRDGMFSYPPTPPAASGITKLTMSFGNQGLWQWEDYTAQDDATEIWWDPTATGGDENGKQGLGMVRYVDGGKRYMPGQRSTAEPKAFDPNGTVTVYDKPPPQDDAPNYPHTQYH
jgi:hypothetical protein